jgi:type IV pilus assembly protein PilM
MAKSAWGIELGTSSVKAVKMSADKGSATLEEVEILSLKDFGLGSTASEDDATAGALNDLRSRKGIKKDDQVFVSISGQNTLGRIISLPPVPKERIRETIQNEARSQIPIKLEEAVWDYQVIEDDDEEELKVNLYAAKREAVDRIIGICESAGLQVTGIQVAPLGIYNYIKYELDDTVSDCCVAIDIGADNTDVVIVDGQKTYVRVVPVAGNDITKALRARFKLNADQAEKLKRNAGKSKDAAAVFEAMKPPLKEMVGEIYRAVGFYKSQNDAANVNQLVMMGNGSKLLNIKKFFEQQLQFQVHKVDTPQRIGLAGTVDPGEVQSSIQSLTVAIGLSLQGLEEDGLNNINLVPPEYIEAKETEKLRVPFFVAAGIAAGGGLIALLVAIFSTTGADTSISQARQLQDNVRQHSSQVFEQTSIGDNELVAYSVRNLLEGQVGTIAGYTTTDADGEEINVPRRPLYLPANAAPAIISEGIASALAAYQRTEHPSRIYFASMPTQRDDGIGEGQTDSYYKWVAGSSSSEWKEMPGRANDEFYAVSREFRGQVLIATQLTPQLSADAAHNRLARDLTAVQALLPTTLRQAILNELHASGQIDIEDAAQVQRIDLNLNVSALQLRPAMIRGRELSGDRFFVRGLMHETVTLQHRRLMGRIISTSPPDTTFSLTRVDVALTLEPVQPLVEEEEQE